MPQYRCLNRRCHWIGQGKANGAGPRCIVCGHEMGPWSARATRKMEHQRVLRQEADMTRQYADWLSSNDGVHSEEPGNGRNGHGAVSAKAQPNGVILAPRIAKTCTLDAKGDRLPEAGSRPRNGDRQRRKPKSPNQPHATAG